MTLDAQHVAYIAKVAHMVNRTYRASIGENPGDKWSHAEDEKCRGIVTGVRHVLATPGITPEQSHAAWLEDKVRYGGWIYGEVEKPYASPPEHPCVLDWDALPKEQQNKDVLFIGIVVLLGEMLS